MKLDTNSVTEVIRPCHIEAVTVSHSWVVKKSQVSVLKSSKLITEKCKTLFWISLVANHGGHCWDGAIAETDKQCRIYILYICDHPSSPIPLLSWRILTNIITFNNKYKNYLIFLTFSVGYSVHKSCICVYSHLLLQFCYSYTVVLV